MMIIALKIEETTTTTTTTRTGGIDIQERPPWPCKKNCEEQVNETTESELYISIILLNFISLCLSGCNLPIWLSDMVTNSEIMLYMNIGQELRLIPANSTVQIGYQLYLECPGKG